MAFYIHKVDDGHVPSIEYLPASAITPKVGLALTQTGGKLAVASGTTAPAYISMTERDAAVTAGDIIPVIRVDDRTVYATEFTAAGTSINLGDKVTLDASGLGVTATKTGGVAEVVEIGGTAVGDRVYIRFSGKAEVAGGNSN